MAITEALTEREQQGLDHMTATRAPPEVRQVADQARKGFVMRGMPAGMPELSRKISHAVTADSFVETIRRVLLIAPVLALASAVRLS
jgi:hypothetical protein